jgi:uncharacterized protein (DUF3084 family)
MTKLLNSNYAPIDEAGEDHNAALLRLIASFAKNHDANPAMARITRQRREQAKVDFSSGRFPTIPATSANSEVAKMMR